MLDGESADNDFAAGVVLAGLLAGAGFGVFDLGVELSAFLAKLFKAVCGHRRVGFSILVGVILIFEL